MKFLQNIKSFLSRHKKKVNSIFKSLDDIKEERNFRNVYYVYNIENDEINRSDLQGSNRRGTVIDRFKRELSFRNYNDNLIILKGLFSVSGEIGLYNGSNKEMSLNLNLFIKDLIDICNKRRLYIITIHFKRELNRKVTAEFFVREKDFEDGESLPNDVRQIYRTYIKSMFSRRRLEYMEIYNIKKDSEFYKFYDPGDNKIYAPYGVFSTKIVITLSILAPAEISLYT